MLAVATSIDGNGPGCGPAASSGEPAPHHRNAGDDVLAVATSIDGNEPGCGPAASSGEPAAHHLKAGDGAGGGHVE